MACFIPLEERTKFLEEQSLANAFARIEEDWDWMDEYYFLLSPFFGWSWQDFEEFPFPRMVKYAEKIQTRAESMEETLSLRELELLRCIGRMFGTKE